MDMPRPGYTSLTLKDEAAQKVQMFGATWPSGQSGLILEVFKFLAVEENWKAFMEFCTQEVPQK